MSIAIQPLHFPNNIQIQTTSRCNARCIFCPHPVLKKQFAEGDMPEALFRKIVDELAEYDCELIQPFLMNDPLMDPHMLSRLDYLLGHTPRARVCITTNGELLTPDLSRQLSRLPLDIVHISAPALTAPLYRRLMHVDGNTVLSNVNTLIDCLQTAQSSTRVVITSILLKQNRKELFIMRDYWRSRNVEVYINPLNNRAGNLRADIYKALLPFGNRLNMSNLISYNMSGCPSLYSFAGILYNGDVVTCCMDWRHQMVMGNVHNTSLYAIWHAQPYARLRDLSDRGLLARLPLCRECGLDRFGISQQLIGKGMPPEMRQIDHDDRELLHNLTQVCGSDPDSLKLGLIR